MIPHLFLEPMMHHPVCFADTQPSNNIHRIYAADQVQWSSLSLPTPIGTSSTVIGSMAFLPVPTALIHPYSHFLNHLHLWKLCKLLLEMIIHIHGFLLYPLHLKGLSLKSPKALEIITTPTPPTTFALKGESITLLTYCLNNNSLSTWAKISIVPTPSQQLIFEIF